MAAPIGSSVKMRFPGLATGAGCDHQGNQVLLAGMGEAAKGAARQLCQQGIALEAGDSTVVSHSSNARARPGVSGLHVSAQIVEAHAAADDQHALVAERSQGTAGGQVERGIKAKRPATR